MANRLLAVALTVLAAALSDPSSHLASACKVERARFCANAGRGAVLAACLAQHHVSLSLRCRRAVAAAEPAA